MATKRNSIFERTSIAPSGGVACGTLALYRGKIWISQGLKSALENEVVSWRSDCVVEVTKTAASTEYADGDNIYADLTTGLSVATGGTLIGAARAASANGALTVLVALNEQSTLATGGVLAAAQQALSGAGAINVTTYYTAWTTTGANAGTLADGLFVGQRKKVQQIVDGGVGTLTPANFGASTSIAFEDAGDFVELIWDGADWILVARGNDADGATLPTVT